MCGATLVAPLLLAAQTPMHHAIGFTTREGTRMSPDVSPIVSPIVSPDVARDGRTTVSDLVGELHS